MIRHLLKVGLIAWFLLTPALISSNLCKAQSVYITNTGEKYHNDGCQYLKRSKIETTLAKALEQGYTACSVCKPSSGKSKSSGSSGTSTQCSAKTKSGTRCSRMTKEANGRCWQHQ